MPPHILPGSLAACKAVWQAALAVLSPAVLVQPLPFADQDPGVAACVYERQFAACAGSVRMLHLGRRYPYPEAAGLTGARCLELVSPQLHSLSITLPFDITAPVEWAWARQLYRVPGLQRLAIRCQSIDNEQAAALGRLPLRQLVLDFSWLSEDLHLPALAHVELLSITAQREELPGGYSLPASGAWMGTGLLQRLVLRQVQVSPPPPVLTRLVALELGQVSLPCLGPPVLSIAP